MFWTSAPSLDDQRRTQASSPPESTRVESGVKAREVTAPRWAEIVARQVPAAGSHSLILPSALPEASCVPSGPKATAVTSVSWPEKVPRRVPFVDQSRSVPSRLADTKEAPSGENATEVTLLECGEVEFHTWAQAEFQRRSVLSSQPERSHLDTESATEVTAAGPTEML